MILPQKNLKPPPQPCSSTTMVQSGMNMRIITRKGIHVPSTMSEVSMPA